MEPQSIIRCELKSAWMNQNELVQSYKELTLRVVVDLDQFLFGLRSGTHLGPGGRKRHERQQQAHCKHTNAHRQPLSFLSVVTCLRQASEGPDPAKRTLVLSRPFWRTDLTSRSVRPGTCACR